MSAGLALRRAATATACRRSIRCHSPSALQRSLRRGDRRCVSSACAEGEVLASAIDAHASGIAARFGFPYTEGQFVEDFGCSPAKAIELLKPLSLDERTARLEDVVADRIFGIVPLVEGLCDLGNISAVARTAEGLGLGSLHIVADKDDQFKQSARTSSGSHKWLHVKRWTSARDSLLAAKRDGYQIVATHLDASAVPMEEIDFSQRTVVIFGNEHAGVSQEALALADRTAAVPMRGFVESFNISVAAAIVLKGAVDRRVAGGRGADGGGRGDLSAQERQILEAIYHAKHRGPKVREVLDELLKREANGRSS